MKLFYIRHAPTAANVVGDIVKDYDSQDIIDFDADDWRQRIGCHLPKSFKLFVSPAKRCEQTAKKLFPFSMKKDNLLIFMEIDLL